MINFIRRHTTATHLSNANRNKVHWAQILTTYSGEYNNGGKNNNDDFDTIDIDFTMDF